MKRGIFVRRDEQSFRYSICSQYTLRKKSRNTRTTSCSGSHKWAPRWYEVWRWRVNVTAALLGVCIKADDPTIHGTRNAVAHTHTHGTQLAIASVKVTVIRIFFLATSYTIIITNWTRCCRASELPCRVWSGVAWDHWHVACCSKKGRTGAHAFAVVLHAYENETEPKNRGKTVSDNE